MHSNEERSRRRFCKALGLGAGLLLTGCGKGCRDDAEQISKKARKNNIPVFHFEKVKDYPHDDTAFTQGLLWDDGAFFESTGHYGQSTVRRVELQTGKVANQSRLSRDYFGEGLTLVGNELYQLTWKEEVVFVYDKQLSEKRRLKYKGEMWGVVHDGKQLILSDGTAVLKFLDPVTLREVRRLEVRMAGTPRPDLNELELIDGQLWANIWQVDGIARIDVKTGDVLGWIDASDLWPRDMERPKDGVLNGIAYDSKDRRIFVTGKFWPRLYEVKCKPAS